MLDLLKSPGFLNWAYIVISCFALSLCGIAVFKGSSIDFTLDLKKLMVSFKIIPTAKAQSINDDEEEEESSLSPRARLRTIRRRRYARRKN